MNDLGTPAHSVSGAVTRVAVRIRLRNRRERSRSRLHRDGVSLRVSGSRRSSAVPAMGGRLDETQFACRKRDPESRKNRRQDDDRGRSDKRAGDEEFLAKRTMSWIVRKRCLAVPGLRQSGGASRNCGNMYVGLSDVTGLQEVSDTCIFTMRSDGEMGKDSLAVRSLASWMSPRQLFSTVKPVIARGRKRFRMMPLM